MPRLATAAALALFLSGEKAATGFVVPVPVPTGFATATAQISRHHTSLCARLPSDPSGGDGGNVDDSSDSVEANRRRLEALLGFDSTGESDFARQGRGLAAVDRNKPSKSLIPREWEDQLDAPPPLTSIARERRLAEIALLRSLDASDRHPDDFDFNDDSSGDDIIDHDEDDDAALSDLWALWFSERGPDAASALLKAEELASQGPHYYDEAEAAMRGMIEEHGIHWSEPVNRLATLLYQRGRLDEARALCQLVLAVKPWHFGALSGIVLVCAGMGDKAGARLWADRRLPPVQPVGANRRRGEWVRRAVEESCRALGKAEERVVEGFGETDEKYYEASSLSGESSSKSGSDSSNEASEQGPRGGPELFDSDEDAWQ